MAVKKTRKLPGLVAIHSYCKDNAFTAVKRDEVRELPFVNRRCTNV